MKIEDFETKKKDFYSGAPKFARLVTFDSFDEMVKFAHGPDAKPLEWSNQSEWDRHAKDSEFGATDRWRNRKSTAMLLEEFNRPPDALVDAVMDMKRKVEDAVTDIAEPQTVGRRRRKRTRRQEHGEELDPEAWVQRRTDGWERVDRQPRPHQVVKIGVNVVINSRRSAYNLFSRSAAAIALADLLIDKGYSVEIIAYMCTRNAAPDQEFLITEIPAKRAFDPMDIGQVSICLAELAFFRISVLQTICGVSRPGLYGTLGYARPLPEGYGDECDVLIEMGVITEDQAIETVAQAMKALSAE